MNDFSPPPPPLPVCRDWIPGVALSGTLAQADRPYGVHVRSELRFASGFHPTRPRGKDLHCAMPASSRAAASGFWLPPIGPIKDSHLLSFIHVQRTALAVTGYEAAKRRFPAGCDQVPAPPLLEAGTLLAWSAVVLPFLEESGVASRIDLSRAWNDHRSNAAAAVARVPAYYSGH